ncbi:hypothetical protein ABIB27_003652 [Arthrobacter sp. UYEF21]
MSPQSQQAGNGLAAFMVYRDATDAPGHQRSGSPRERLRREFAGLGHAVDRLLELCPEHPYDDVVAQVVMPGWQRGGPFSWGTPAGPCRSSRVRYGTASHTYSGVTPSSVNECIPTAPACVQQPRDLGILQQAWSPRAVPERIPGLPGMYTVRYIRFPMRAVMRASVSVDLPFLHTAFHSIEPGKSPMN